MGCSFGTPLTQPINGVQSANRNSDLPNGTTMNNQNVVLNINNEDQVKPREFFSFTSFISKNDNPTIFEWTFIREIGEGSKSHIYLAENIQTGKQYAAKVYNKSHLMCHNIGSEEPPITALQREIDIMAAITHKYSISISEIIEDELSNSLIILSPFAKQGTLQSYYKSHNLNEINIAICFYQIAQAICYMHSLQIVHRNITPDNILVFSDILYRISNYSDSTIISTQPDGKLKDIVGETAFLSPEECSKKPFFPKPSDVWSYGISLYLVAFDKLPFNLTFSPRQNEDLDQCLSQMSITFAKEQLSFPDGTSDDLIDILKMILVKDAYKRPTFEKIINHPWFNEAREVDQMNNEEEAEIEIYEEEEEEKSLDKEET